MKSFVAVLALIVVAAADVSHLTRNAEAAAETLKQESDVLPDQFQYNFETSNGISAQASGRLENVGTEYEAISVQGSNQHTGTDGIIYQTSYIADANGYQPSGAHLPTPPPAEPIPEYIQRSLDYIRAHPPQPETVQRRQF